MSVDVLQENVLMQRLLNLLLLGGEYRIKPLPADIIQQVDLNDLRVWCVNNARYGVPTAELIHWLRVKIGTRSAIEIGAGMGDLGSSLRIKMTDSYQQVNDADTNILMSLFQQKPTKPMSDVEQIDAQSAVLKYKPQVVIGSWITQRWLPGDEHGNMHGPREEEIIKNCETYIVIGNEAIHGDKRIMVLPHETFYFPWLVSRAKDQSKNVIYVWGK
jgi:hypothetical protein